MKHPHFLKNSLQARVAPPVSVRFDAKAGTIRGYASAFGGPADSYGDVVEKGAFARTLADHRREGTMPLMLWSHDPARPVGRWKGMREDDFGLLVEGELNLDTQAGKDAHAHLAAGDVNGFSIGFAVPKSGSRFEGGINYLTDLDLLEVSVVAFPANRRARLSGVKTMQSKSELVDLLREGGLAKAAAERIAAAGWPALAGPDHHKATELAAAIERATANLRRTK